MARCNARDAAAVMLAWAPGKEVEYKLYGGSEWRSTTCPSWNWDAFEFRIKPTAKPNLRPWTADEVPLGSVVRYKTDPQRRFLLVNVESELGRRELLEKCEVLAGCGFKWLPCGVVEDVNP